MLSMTVPYIRQRKGQAVREIPATARKGSYIIEISGGLRAGTEGMKLEVDWSLVVAEILSGLPMATARKANLLFLVLIMDLMGLLNLFLSHA